jgi:hypothetical protein
MTSDKPTNTALSPRELNDRATPEDVSGITSVLDHLLDSLDGVPDAGPRVEDHRPVERLRPRLRFALDQATLGAATGTRRGQDVTAAITITPDAVRTGARCSVAFTVGDTCPTCGGTGCDNCSESGRAEVERHLQVRVPPGLDDGAQLRVVGQGSKPTGRGPAGDLVLTVRVPEPPEGRLIILVSFIGALLALWFLIYMLVVATR